MEWQRDGFTISTDRGRIDRDLVHRFLGQSYWARGIPRATVDRSIDNALCFGVYVGPQQVGFARVVSDLSTFAYLADVFILESHRGRGLAAWLMEIVKGHPQLQGLRRWMLVTRDAHALYRKAGFEPLAHPDRHMEIAMPDLYTKLKA